MPQSSFTLDKKTAYAKILEETKMSVV